MNMLCISTNMTSAEWAAWVQAIGSLLSIAAAFLVADRQHRLEKHSQREATNEDGHGAFSKRG